VTSKGGLGGGGGGERGEGGGESGEGGGGGGTEKGEGGTERRMLVDVKEEGGLGEDRRGLKEERSMWEARGE